MLSGQPKDGASFVFVCLFVCLFVLASTAEVYFLTVLETGTLRPRCQREWFSGEAFFWFADNHFSLCLQIAFSLCSCTLDVSSSSPSGSPMIQMLKFSQRFQSLSAFF